MARNGRGKSEFVIRKLSEDTGTYIVKCWKDSGEETHKSFPFTSPNASLSAKIYAEMMQENGWKYRVVEDSTRVYVWERQ